MKEKLYNFKFTNIDLLFIGLIALACLAILFFDPLLIILGILLVMLLILAYQWPVYFLGLTILLYPFNQKYLYLGWSTNFPYADLLIIILATSWLIKFILKTFQDKRLYLTKQAKINFAFFICLMAAGALSFLNIWTDQIAESFKYLWRFIAFNYLLYFFITQEIVKKAKHFWTLSWFVYFLGIFLSIMGLVSFYWPEVNHSFPMATPLSWFGLFPLGASHNLLAESLVSIIPFSWLLIYKLSGRQSTKYMNFGLSLMIAVCILTFSRTGWLVLAIELLILYIAYYRVRVKSVIQKFWPLGLALLLLFGVYFTTFAQTEFVTSSNEARGAMIERSIYMFSQHPVIGNGVGVWQSIVSRDMYYVYEFGQPLEQHGVVWKLLAEQGIVGVLVWFGIMFYLIYYSYYVYHKLEHDNPWQFTALVAGVVIVGQVIFQLLDTGYYSPKMWLPLGLAMSLLHIAKRFQGLPSKIKFE